MQKLVYSIFCLSLFFIASLCFGEKLEHIVYNDLGLSKKIAKETNSGLLVIFTADWCKYCEMLKQDEGELFGDRVCVICYLDFDKEDNKQLAKKTSVKILPTSVIIDPDKEWKEKSRQEGYRYEEYKKWINKNF